MAQFIEGAKRSFPAGSSAIPQFSRVILSGGVLVEAGEGDVELGTIEYEQFSSNFLVDLPVRLRNAQGTVKMVAAGAITSGAPVYGAASGQVTATPNRNFIGFALSAATGANSIVEVERAHVAASPAGQAVVEAHTANYTVTTGDSGKVFSNAAATGEVDFTLPTAAVGLQYDFAVDAAQLLKIVPQSGDQIGTPSTSTVPATGVPLTAGYDIKCSTVGATVSLRCTLANEWRIVSSAGNWATN